MYWQCRLQLQCPPNALIAADCAMKICQLRCMGSCVHVDASVVDLLTDCAFLYASSPMLSANIIASCARCLPPFHSFFLSSIPTSDLKKDLPSHLQVDLRSWVSTEPGNIHSSSSLACFGKCLYFTTLSQSTFSPLPQDVCTCLRSCFCI